MTLKRREFQVLAPLDTRIQNSLKRVGCTTVRTIIMTDGTVRLEGRSDSPEDRSIAIAIVKTVAGVTRLSNEIRASEPA